MCDFVFAPAEVEAQDGDSPVVNDSGIDVAEAVLVGDHFAASGETDGAAVAIADRFLEVSAVALVSAGDSAEGTDARHAEAAADFDVIAAGEFLVFLVELPPRHVDVAAGIAVAVVRGRPSSAGMWPDRP